MFLLPGLISYAIMKVKLEAYVSCHAPIIVRFPEVFLTLSRLNNLRHNENFEYIITLYFYY